MDSNDPTMNVIKITTIAIARCSITILNGLSFCARANRMLNAVIIKRPQMMSTTTAISSDKNQIGITKVNAKMNFARNVDMVASHTSLPEWIPSDSSDTCMATASEKASAIAMAIIAAITAKRELVLAFTPTIIPSVVMTPDVIPKLIPFLVEVLIVNLRP